MKYFTLITVLLSILFVGCGKNSNPEITKNELHDHVAFLADDSLYGRYPGTTGAFKAAEYIQESLEDNGFKPLFNDGIQTFDIIKIKEGKNNSLRVADSAFTYNEDFAPFGFSQNGVLNEEVAFCGYGFDISKDSIEWNDYKNIDVAGKWVMVLRGYPDQDKDNSPFSDAGTFRSKVITAEEKGAAGIIIVSGPKNYARESLIKLHYDGAGRAGIAAIHIKREIADMILHKSGATVEMLENRLLEDRKPISFNSGMRLAAHIDIEYTSVNGQNVVFELKGSDPKLSEEYIVIGGHYDHLGMGGEGTSSRALGRFEVHNGADDNGSGVASVLELAQYLTLHKPKRSVLFVLFDGEEMGLLGSKAFVEKLPVDSKKINMMFNLDMIGRLKPNGSLLVSGVGTTKEFEPFITETAEKHDLKIDISKAGYGPSDHASFYTENIPVLFFTTGAHTDYHTPEDDTELVDFPALEKISKYIAALVSEAANRDEMFTFQESGPKVTERHRDKMKVKLGILPDFAGTVENGLKIDGISDGGPAELGGLKKDDIIVAIDGKPVKNIYGYMKRLSDYKVGDTILVDVLRDGKKEVFIIRL